MRPEKAVVVVCLADFSRSEVLNSVVEEGIAGRLVLRGSESVLEAVGKLGAEADIFADQELGRVEVVVDVRRRLVETEAKVVYALLARVESAEEVLRTALDRGWFVSVVVDRVLDVVRNTSKFAPRQSYEFVDCRLLEEKLDRSVFYADFEKDYTRKDWVKTITEEGVGANGQILFEKHHLEIMTRLGLKAKYGS
jgi:hypothetical protein